VSASPIAVSASSIAVSVAISTADRAPALARCLEALARGSSPPDEVIVVDQSRGDETEAVVANAGGLAARHVRQKGRGLGRAQNAAVGASAGPIVAVTDDDCIPAADWIATLRARFAASDAPDALMGRVVALPPRGDRTAPVSLRESLHAREFRGRTLPWDIGSGNNFAVRREVYLAIGGCDERLGPGSPGQGGVDMDLFYRLARTGRVLRYDPALVVAHERDTPAGRLARRPMYGHGVGAMAALRLREGDWYMAPMLLRWTALRGGRLARALARGDHDRIREERLMLRGTLAGIRHGLTAGREV
jgi:GT2 family glycosyltransferase